MYKLIATIYEKGVLIGYKITNNHVEEELSIDETYLLALSNLIINIEAGSNKNLIGKNGFDIKTIERIDKDFGQAPAYHTISAYILKSAGKSANMMFKPDLIIKQAINNINRDKDKNEYIELEDRNDLVIEKVVYGLDQKYFSDILNRSINKNDKDKYKRLLESDNNKININDIENLILKTFGYSGKSDEETEITDAIRDLLTKERKSYRKIVGYEVVNCGTDTIRYIAHDLKNNLGITKEINPGESKYLAEYDLKMLMAKKGYNGSISNANLGFTPQELDIKDGKTLINKCITIKLLDNSIINRQIYIGEIEKELK